MTTPPSPPPPPPPAVPDVPAPGPGPGPDPEPAPPGERRSSHRVVAVVAGLVAFLVAGVGAYLLARDYQVNQVTQSCGSYACIPRLKAATVVKALEDQGYACQASFNHRYCELRVGTVNFKVTLSVADEHIYEIDASIFRSDGAPLTKTGVDFLSWFATLPYRDDPVTTTDIQEWLAEQIKKDKETKATILDYQYVLRHPEEEIVELIIKGTA